MVNTTSPSVVYMDVITNGFGKARVLRQSAQFDVATCGEAADVNLDGEREVAIGTAGQSLIVYKWNERADEWLLQFMRRMDDPIHAIRSVDLTGDGLQELVVQTTKVISTESLNIWSPALTLFDNFRQYACSATTWISSEECKRRSW